MKLRPSQPGPIAALLAPPCRDKTHPPRAFSLLELMIAITILGLGMIMVATMFPVAWERARTLTEFTTQQTIATGADATTEALIHVSSPNTGSSSLMGDLVYEPGPSPAFVAVCGVGWESDDWVHALNVENRRLIDPSDPRRTPLAENLWLRQIPDGGLRQALDPIDGDPVGSTFYENSYFRPQIAFHQRIHPPVEPFPLEGSDDELDRWEEDLSTRRFCWAVLHRLRQKLDDPVEQANATRAIDLYYVTLRRPRSTLRYAQQDIESSPDPCEFMKEPVTPKARPATEDMMLPVPWRVQIEFPNSLVPKLDPGTGEPNATGIPTEVEVPPEGVADADTNPETGVMLVQMFPKGAEFIDEITGEVFRVVKQRTVDASDTRAVLTLNREVFIDDIDLLAGDPRCNVCQPKVAEEFERVRTVWVFPPPVQDDGTTQPGPRVFEGNHPVVGIDVRSINLAPAR